MPLCKHKQSQFTEVAAEVVQFDHRADFGLELLSFRGKTGSISESLLFANHFIWPTLQGYGNVFHYAFVERRNAKISRNSSELEVLVLELLSLQQ